MMNKEKFQCAAILCEHVALKILPILHAERDEAEDADDSGWQFVCGKEEENWEKAQVWALREVLALDNTLVDYVDLPAGTILHRSKPQDAWTVEKE